MASGEQTYQSEDYYKARPAARSAAESYIYTLKQAYGLGRLAKRWVGPVDHEMLEAKLAYKRAQGGIPAPCARTASAGSRARRIRGGGL